eukprot:TRINITY_DN7474_c0_g1_i1.p1 TRINITY_DN7474_c0_g1~~TRINITY_DN7474_c0_g1_i1.p1  ORF type:complete len:313 (-),score=50.90 TRINITY_DN7474_c0_g1_i1:13-951(-)
MPFGHCLIFLCIIHLSFSVKIFLSSEFQNGPEEWKPQNAKKLAKECPLPCSITNSITDSDCVLSHCRDPLDLRTVDQDKLRAVYCTDDEAEYRTAYLRSDILVTTDFLETAQVVPVSTLKNISAFLQEARLNLANERKRIMEIGFIADSLDPVKQQIVEDLSKYYPVFSYGKVLLNTPWPVDKVGDKVAVFKDHKFCLAIEDSDRGATTDRLWDCLRAASVPIYYGNTDMIDHSSVPENSIIRVKRFQNAKLLSEHLWELMKKPEEYEKYRSWISSPNTHFIEFHRVRSPSTQVCRLCIKVATNPMFQDPNL